MVLWRMKKNIRGFSPNEIVELYRYLCIFGNDLENIGSQKELVKKYPKLKDLEKKITGFVSNYYTRESLKTIAITPMENLVSMTKCRSSKVLSFLHHLRNSIAHGQIEQEGGSVHLIDYGKENKAKVFSARGIIKSTTLFEIINDINENIKLS